jgi:hypothetical protein
MCSMFLCAVLYLATDLSSKANKKVGNLYTSRLELGISANNKQQITKVFSFID